MNATNHKSIYHISYLPLHLEELVQHEQVQVQPQLLPVYFLQHHGFHFPDGCRWNLTADLKSAQNSEHFKKKKAKEYLDFNFSIKIYMNM